MFLLPKNRLRQIEECFFPRTTTLCDQITLVISKDKITRTDLTTQKVTLVQGVSTSFEASALIMATNGAKFVTIVLGVNPWV